MSQLTRADIALLIVGIVTFVMMGAGSSIYGPALPAFQRDYGLSPAAAGFLISAHWIGCALGVAAMYLRGEALEPRHATALMAVGAVIIMAGLGFAGMVVGALTFGAGYGCATAVFNPRILRAFGPRGGGMLSLMNATFAFGAIATPLVFVWLGSNVTLSFAIVAVIAVAAWLGAGLAGTSAPPPPRATGPFNPRLGLMSFAAISIGMEACMIGLGPTALIATGMAEETAARYLSLFFVAFLAARIVLIFVADRVPAFGLYLVSLAMMALFAFGAAMLDPAVFFVAMGLCVGLFFPTFYVAAAKVMGDDPRVSPTIIAAGLVGGISGPMMIGAVMGHLGQTGFFWVIAVLAAITAGLAFVVGRPSLRA
jgi:fucose permease